MRVALISDLHGNLVALDAVLDHATKAMSADRVVCLGDVCPLGPEPSRVLETLSSRAIPCILGNHDDFMLDPTLIRMYTESELVVDSVDACRASLDQGAIDFIRTFEKSLAIDMDGVTLSLFHGSPRSHMEDLLATTPPEALDEALGEKRTAVMAGGHTHIQMLRQHGGTLLVNPGSLGCPFERYVQGGPPRILGHAEYAIVESAKGGVVSVTLHRVPLDRTKLIAQTEKWDNPMKAYLLAQYRMP